MYRAPLQEQLLAYELSQELSGTNDSMLDRDLSQAILGEMAKLAEGAFEPLDALGDRIGAQFDQGRVTSPDGFAEAYREYAEGGWSALGAEEAFGGQGLPFAISAITQEQLSAANMAFALCMFLSQGAISAITAHASESLKELYLPAMVSGRWTGTMNLTEPQAGSDLALLRTRATPADDGTYRIAGTKIFITWGEHELAENIVHLVLARLPDAPPGTRGISLFLVPKFLPDEDGRPGLRNDLVCASIEHKLGIHASPTCTMSFGDNGQCVGWLVGEPNGGLAAMFTMMNHARINVGLQGVAVAEVASQKALAYARERVQSAVFGGVGKQSVAIIEHADVRRMLMTMRALTDAARAIAYLNAAAVDAAHMACDDEQRQAAQGRADFLTPITKAFGTDIGVEVASLGVQVFGGMGFIEETGIARHLRDARITPIYEGTNGIQAIDLIGRKLRSANGAHCNALLGDMRQWLGALSSHPAEVKALLAALDELEATSWVVVEATGWDAASGATSFLRQFALVLGGILLLRQADAVEGSKTATAQFFVAHILPQAAACAASVRAGGDMLGGPADLLFAGE